jgi:hypothetical protein
VKNMLTHLPALITATCCLAMLVYGPIAQTGNYHAFADDSELMGIPHGGDVISNLGFAIVGFWGILNLWPQRQHPAIKRSFHPYVIFLVGLILTACGSSYYHLQPDDYRLLWDRLPIALACAGLLAAVWSETALIEGRALTVTVLLSLYSVGSVLWWYITELNGQGDLRPYLLLQILPILLIPIWQGLYHSAMLDRLWFAAALLLYIVAKIAEVYDHAVLEVTNHIVSGHTIKHFLATAAAAAIVYRLIQRTRMSR